jgi:hypothetical protein
MFIKSERVIRASPVALWSENISSFPLSPEEQIYWTVQNKSSQVTEKTRSVSAVVKLSIIPDSLPAELVGPCKQRRYYA